MADLDLELAIERTFDAPLDAVWTAMTTRTAEWWCPRPWSTEVVDLEWKSGGAFNLTMKSDEGEAFPGDGVLLEVVPKQRIVFSNTLNKHWQPQPARPMGIVGVFELSDAGGGKTHYRASARHWSAEDMAMHKEMGFEGGWGICADQLEEVAKKVTADA